MKQVASSKQLSLGLFALLLSYFVEVVGGTSISHCLIHMSVCMGINLSHHHLPLLVFPSLEIV